MPTQLKAKGVDTIACMAVNDVFVMKAWGETGKAAGKVEMLADGNGEYARALGLELDASKFGMGTRGKRFSVIVDNGVVKTLNIEPPGEFGVSSAETRAEAALGALHRPCLERGDELGQRVKQIGDEADVGHLEDRGSRILVDRDDRARVLDAREVLDRAGDADGDVELRRDDLAGLTYLQIVRDEPESTAAREAPTAAPSASASSATS